MGADVVSHGVAEDVIECLALGDVFSSASDDGHQFHFIVDLLAGRRTGNGIVWTDDRGR